MSRRHRQGKPGEEKSTSQSSSVPQSSSGVLPTRPSAVTSKPEDRRSLWLRFKNTLTYWSIWFFFASPIVVPVVLGIVYVPFYRASLTSAEFTVDRRERVVQGGGEYSKAYYLVWSKEGEVFCVTDTWSFMSFDSSDRYGKLREGSKVKVMVAGWRVPFLSWYRNVVEIAEVKSPSS